MNYIFQVMKIHGIGTFIKKIKMMMNLIKISLKILLKKCPQKEGIILIGRMELIGLDGLIDLDLKYDIIKM